MSEAPERIWAWWDDAYDVGLLNEHGDKRYTPNDAKEYVRADEIERLQARVAELEAERDEADDLANAAFADGASNNILLAEAAHRIKLLETRAEAAEALLSETVKAAIKEATLSRLAHLGDALEAAAWKARNKCDRKGEYALGQACYDTIRVLAPDPETIARIVAQVHTR